MQGVCVGGGVGRIPAEKNKSAHEFMRSHYFHLPSSEYF